MGAVAADAVPLLIELLLDLLDLLHRIDTDIERRFELGFLHGLVKVPRRVLLERGETDVRDLPFGQALWAAEDKTGYFTMQILGVRTLVIYLDFEQLGWPEQKIVVRFWIVSAILGLVALSTLKLR